MAIRITDAQRDIVHINKAFKQLEIAQQNITALQSQIAALQVAQSNTEDLTRRTYFNTTTFTWTGATLTLSWNNSYVKDKKENVFPILSGSRVLLASTYYWTAWNIRSNYMVIQTNLSTITNNPDNLVLGSLYTGTGAQAGSAGGGGTEGGGTGDDVGRYKDF